MHPYKIRPQTHGHPGSTIRGRASSSRLCFVESDHGSGAAADRQRVLEPDAARRLTVFQLIEPLEEAHDGVLSEREFL